jgi:RNA polymerase sigma factor (sigma-70 family)
VLDDVMLHLMQSTVTPPRNLESYVVVVLRNTVRREARLAATRGADNEISLEAARRELRTAAAPADAHSDDDPDGEPVDDDRAGEALRRLYEPVLSGLTPEQRELLGYMLDHVPARVVAQWLNIEHAAARVRIHRLRRLLRTRILARLPLMNAPDRAHVERLLRRAGVVLGAPAHAESDERAETRNDNTRRGA